MKKIITESLIKGAFFSIGATFTIFGVYAATNLISVQSVNNQTVLTSNLWNETMSSLTGAINELKTKSVTIDGTQTISGTKTFSTQVAGVNPTADNHLATRIYVDTAVSAASSSQELQRTDLLGSSTYYNISSFIKNCRDLTHNGYSDWRLPTAEEAILFVGDGITSTSVITRTPVERVYQSNTLLNDSEYYYFNVNMGNGSTSVQTGNSKYFCVRG